MSAQFLNSSAQRAEPECDSICMKDGICVVSGSGSGSAATATTHCGEGQLSTLCSGHQLV
eukprot:9155767-Heterocapsa_arctica.AAC.1